MYDIAIIGGGPAGYNAAHRAGAAGKKIILFEKEKLGGVCLNWGCIPTKTLLHSAKILDYAKNASDYGVLTENVSFDFAKIFKRKDTVVRRLTGGINQLMKKHNIEIVNFQAELIENSNNAVSIKADDKTFEAKNCIIATGSKPAIPPINGINSDIVYTSRDIFSIGSVPKSIVIIGGGVIGMEFCSFFNSLGSNVTIIEMLDEILSGSDREISTLLRKEYEKKGIKFELGSKVTSLNGNVVEYKKDGEIFSVNADTVLLCIGRKPNIEGIGLEKIGLELENGSIKVNESMQTNFSNIFAPGDVNGKSLLAHTAYRESEVVINSILGQKDKMNYNAIPNVIYTNSEVAGVGITEDEAKQKNMNYECKKLPMAYSGRFVSENHGKSGLCKIIADKNSRQILGVHMIGNPCSEIIYGAAAMIEKRLKIDDVKEIVFPHPTVSEIFRDVIFDF